MSRKFGGLISSLTSARRDFSPPERTATFLWTSSSAEEERTEHAARLLLRELVLRRAELHHVLEDGQLRVEVVDAVLGEITRDDVAAFLAEAAVDRDDAGEDLEQRRLAGAVRADEHRALAAFALEVEVLIDDVVAVGLLDMLELHHLEAGARRLGEAELDLLQVVFGLVDRDLFEAGDLLLLRLRAGGHRSLGAEAVDERLQVGDLALLVLNIACWRCLRASRSTRKSS
jgi:hypothetical protein